VAAGVEKRNVTASSSTPPVADVVPAGISTAYSVAIGKRLSSSTLASKERVWVPSHFQTPGSSGVILTGAASAASCSSVPSGTMGWLKVTLTKGTARSSPSGA
jgi:hypothetical protein